MPEWLWPALSIAGALIGAWLGVRITVTRLETQMENVLKRLDALGDRSHAHAQLITETAMKVGVLERQVAALERQRGIER